MKVVPWLALGIFTFQMAQGALLLEDHFSYPNGNLGASGIGDTVWTEGDSPNTPLRVTNAAALDYSGLAGATGRGVLFSGGTFKKKAAQFTPQFGNGTTVYCSFLLNIQMGPSTVKAFVYLQTTNSATGSPPLGIFLNGSQVGLAKNTSSPAVSSSSLSAGTHLIVARYTFQSGNDQVDLWIDPASLGDNGSVPAATLTTGTGSSSDAAELSYIFLNHAASQTLWMDEVRVGPTWADVTPTGTPLPATKLGFTTQPVNAFAGATMSPVVVQVQSAGGAAIASNGVPVTLSLSSGSGTLSGTLTQNTDSTGKATFNDLSIDTTGAGKQLTASASGIGAGLSSATSSSFTIMAPVVGTKLAFTTQPTDELTDHTISPAVVVQIQNDDSLSVASNGVPITLTLSSGSGTLNGTTTQNTDSSGKATFNNLSIDTAGAGKQLTASASGIGTGLTGATSGSFVITQPPVGVKLGFTVQPSTAVAGQTIAPAVLVQVQDQSGLSVSSNGVPITLTLTSGSGTLNGTTTQNTDANGKATFNNLSIDTDGAGKQLTANASGIGTGLTNALSAAFTISPLPPPPPPNGPVITQTLVSPGSVVLRGTNGTHNGNYEVLSSTDLLLSSNLWASIGSNVFDATGNFDSTNSTSTTDVQRYFRLLDEGVPASTNLPDFSHIGFADTGINLTGGAAGPTVYVGNEAELQSYADVNPPYTIYITNSFTLSGMSTHIRANKTVIGVGNVVLSGGGLYLYESTNVIIRNLTISNSTEDNIGLHYSSHVWIDHCTIVNSSDGGIDLTQGSDYTTISWCRFYYTANPPDPNHRFVSLIGASDSDNGSQYHVTYHHNWWGENCIERMPSVRFGRVHVFNNYYNAPGNNYCVRTRIEAECLVENNFFQNVENPWERFTGGTPGLLRATNNNVGYLETSFGVTWSGGGSTVLIPGTDTVFTPPYSPTLAPASSVPNIVTNYAGSGKGPFAP